MISKEQIIRLVDRNPSIGKHTPVLDIRLIRDHYRTIYNDYPVVYEVKKRRKYPIGETCHTCIVEMLNALRVYVGFPTTTNAVTPKLSTQRIDICKKCVYSEGEGVLLSCGPFAKKTKVPEGTLCGCNLFAKTKISFLYCPLGFWDGL